MKAMRTTIAAAMAILVMSASGSAQADLLELHAQIHGGFLGGGAIAGEGEITGDAFFARTSGTYGAIVGAEIFFVDVWVQHDQFVGGGPAEDNSGITGTWTQFMAGFDLQFDIGDPPVDSKGSPTGQAKGFGEIGFGFGYGVGTGQQVDPPLDNSELSDQGFIVETHLVFGYRLHKYAALVAQIPVSIALLNKADGPANVSTEWYGTGQGAVLFGVRATLPIK